MGLLRRTLFVTGLAGLLLIPVPTIAAESRPAPATPRFAYVYLNDAAAAESFKGLLAGHGLALDIVTLDEAPQTDFTKFDAVIAASDVKKAWDSGLAKRIGDSARPVIGLGEGGYYLFERWHLAIGSPYGWHGGEVAVRPMREKSAFWSTAHFDLPDAQEAVLYAESANVGIHMPTPVKGVECIGREVGSASHYAILVQSKRFLLWGFDASPQHMTTLGKQVFIHACRYMIDAAQQTSNSSASATAQSPPSGAESGWMPQPPVVVDARTTILIPADSAILTVQIDGPQIEAVVTDDGIAIHDQAEDRTYELRVVDTAPDGGAQTLEVAETPAGVFLQGSSFQIKRDDDAVVTASFEARPSARASKPKAATKAAAKAASPSANVAIFLGCGNAGGPGQIYQMTLDGKELSAIPLDSPAYGLVRRDDCLIGAIPSVRVGQGKLLRIHADGSTEPLMLDGDLGAPIALALDHKTQDLIVSDNERHTVCRILAPAYHKLETVLHAPLSATSDHFPSMSAAATRDRRLLFSASDPQGLFRSPLKVGEALPAALANADVGVAADPTSNRWVAMFDNELKVYQGDEFQRSIPCADDAVFWHYHVMSFAPDGRLFVVVETGGALEIDSVDLQTGTLTRQFAWHGEKIISMTAGPVLPAH